MKTRFSKVMAIILAAALCLSVLGGCQKSSSGESTAAENPGTTADGKDTQEGGTSEELPVINVVIPHIGTMVDSSDDVVAEINKILAETAKAQIKITWTDYSSHSDTINMMLTNADELDLTLIMGSPLNYVSNGQLYDLTDLAASEEGKAIAEVVSQDRIDAARLDGKNYVIPSTGDIARENAFQFNRALAKEAGYTDIDDEKIWTIDEIHEMLLAIKEIHPEVYGIVSIAPVYNVDTLGDDYYIGVVEDRGSAKKVTSFAESQEFIDTAKLMYQWNQEGLIMPDILNAGGNAMSLIMTGGAAAVFSGGGCPNYMEGDDSWRYILSIDDQWISASMSQRMGYVMNAKCKNPEAAFRVLKEMYCNEDVKTLLAFGIENVNWVKDDQGRATYPEGVTAETATYSVGFNNWFVFPNGMCEMTPFTNAPNYWDLCRDYDATAQVSEAYGCYFDATNVQAEYAECMNVFTQYYSAIICGTMDPDTAIPEFAAALKAAGEDKVIAEKQAQLDAFLATK